MLALLIGSLVVLFNESLYLFQILHHHLRLIKSEREWILVVLGSFYYQDGLAFKLASLYHFTPPFTG